MSKHKYVAPFLTRWSETKALHIPFPVTAAANLGVGFLPVFDTLDSFKAEYPDHEPVLIVVGKKEGDNA